jgi:hypothetical protein
VGGVPVLITEGETLEHDHPTVQAHPALFTAPPEPPSEPETPPEAPTPVGVKPVGVKPVETKPVTKSTRTTRA